jgi:triacylglycerol lipase
MRALLASVLAALLLAVGLSAPVPALAAGGGSPLPLTPENGSPPGANDWSCKPSTGHRHPVVLVHGTYGDRKHLLENLSAAVKAAGYCVYSFNYGNRGQNDIVASAHELKRFVRKVLDSTGARKVSMIGHSQGGMMPRYYIKFLHGARKVDDLVGLSPSNHGTVILGDPDNPITGPLIAGGSCQACSQQTAGSDFLRKLNAGDETPGRVSYTQVTTRYDEVVVPYTSAYLATGRRTTNVTIQDLCPADTAEHVLIPNSRTAIAVALNALRRKGPADKDFRPAC